MCINVSTERVKNAFGNGSQNKFLSKLLIHHYPYLVYFVSQNVAALKQKTEAAEVPGPRPPDRGKRKASELDDEQLLKKIKGKRDYRLI